MNFGIKVYNAPADVLNYVVARLVDGQLWYWGTFKDYESADLCRQQLGDSAVVVEVEQ